MFIPTKFTDYIQSAGGTILGSYRVLQVSGNTVSIGALGHLASIRWAPQGNQFCAVYSIRAGWSVQAAVTAAAQMDMRAIIVRGFSVDFTTASTAISMAAPANTNKMFDQHQNSLMGVNGPRIATTTVMSGQTLTADAAPIGGTVWVNQPSGNATVTQAVGVGGAMQDLYRWTDFSGHPPVLSPMEGIVCQPISAGVVSGAVQYYVEWGWVEFSLYA